MAAEEVVADLLEVYPGEAVRAAGSLVSAGSGRDERSDALTINRGLRGARV